MDNNRIPPEPLDKTQKRALNTASNGSPTSGRAGQPSSPKRQDRHKYNFQNSTGKDQTPFCFKMQDQSLPGSSDFGFIDFGHDGTTNPTAAQTPAYKTTAQITSSSSPANGSAAPLTTPETSPDVGRTYTLIPQEIINLKAAIKGLDNGLLATNEVLQATNLALQASNKALKTSNKANAKAMRKMQKRIEEIEKVATLEAANVEYQTARIDSSEYMMQRTRRKISKVNIDGEIVNLDETSSDSDSDLD